MIIKAFTAQQSIVLGFIRNKNSTLVTTISPAALGRMFQVIIHHLSPGIWGWVSYDHTTSLQPEQDPVSLKKYNQVPTAQEAEAELLESRRWRLQWAEIAPLHSAWTTRAKLHLKEEKRKNGVVVTEGKQKKKRDKEESSAGEKSFSFAEAQRR